MGIFFLKGQNFFFFKLPFIKTNIICFSKVTTSTNHAEKIMTYFVSVHPGGTHAEISTTTKKIGGKNKKVAILT